MKKILSPTWQLIIIKNFNLCFFISLFLLSLIPGFRSLILSDRSHPLADYLLLPAFNGVLTGLVTLIINHWSARNYIHPYYAADRRILFAVAFFSGFLSNFITFSSAATYIISFLIIYLAIANVRSFVGQISQLLRPDKMATLADLGNFANFFINLIITFSVINLSLDTLHGDLNLRPAFDFGSGAASIINALYFSVITMTTVGYGDIIPQTTIARTVVAFECLTSYILLGVMIGIITRGINTQKPKETPEDPGLSD